LLVFVVLWFVFFLNLVKGLKVQDSWSMYTLTCLKKNCSSGHPRNPKSLAMHFSGDKILSFKSMFSVAFWSFFEML